MPGDPRSTAAYQQARREFLRQARALSLPCAICGLPIDYSIKWDRRNPDPRYPTVDHVEPVSKGGRVVNFDNFRPAHLSCNSARGAGGRRILGARKPKNLDRAVPSREW